MGLAPTLVGLALACGGAPPLPPEETVKVPSEGTVVVYVEAPRRLAGPVLKTFSEQTGISVEAHYREQEPGSFYQTLKSEAQAKRVDLVWTASPLLAIDLVRSDLALPFRPAGARPVPGQYHDRGYRWIGFAANPRVIIFNQDLVSRDSAPQSFDDLVEGQWAGKGVLSRIADGPPAYQAAALFSRRGEQVARKFFDRIVSAGNRIVPGDLEVRKLVASGDVAWGIIDLDLAICAKRQADPVHIFFPDRMSLGTVVVPHAAVLVRGAPHLDQAKGLFGYLFATETAWLVGQNDCALLSLLPITAMGIAKPEWVPLLGAINVLAVDNDQVYDAYVGQSAYLGSWGGAPSTP
jgi:iron(III) transport system substrate-binding protein